MTLITYILYLHASAWITFWVGHSLHKNGRYFLVEAFDNEAIADAVNKLLLVGFYLINIAYTLLVLQEEYAVTSVRGIIETVCNKVGLIVFVLAVMHFFNLSVFGVIRHYRSREVTHPFLKNIFKIFS